MSSNYKIAVAAVKEKVIRNHPVVRSRVAKPVTTIQKRVTQAKTIKIAKPVKQHRVQINRPVQDVKRKPAIAVLNKGHIKKPKRTKVKYLTPNPDAVSLEKIAALRNVGLGKILIIIANGPSILEVNFEELKGKKQIHFMSINKPYDKIWPTEYWTFFDRSQFRRHEQLWYGYNGYIFNSTSIKEQKQKSMQFKNIMGHGFSKEPIKGIHIGRSSVYGAMQIALWMNYDHIYIFGVDMNADGLNNQLHFYGVNEDVKPEVRSKRFANEAEYYQNATTVLDKNEALRFTFCSAYNPWPFINLYNSVDHREAVDLILEKTGYK